ncbi:MAG: diguanylate cyclase [Desulfobacterales bacterium]|nr:diguanylate cyclase [Desulfobacterales bacterium]
MSILRQSSSHQKSENPGTYFDIRYRESDWDQTNARKAPEQTPPPRERESRVDSLPQLIAEYLHKLPRSVLIAIAFVILASVGILNHLTGPDLSTWIFYLIPIFLVTWFTERWIGILMSIVSTLTWLIADYTSGATYLDHAIPYWNCIARLGSFLILTSILSALKSALEKEKELSRIDFLTGVGNSRYFIELANMEINRALRYQHPLTVVNIDLDNFKTINDRYGHSTGDNLLRLVANTIKNNIRLTDTVARVGGDEFSILLPETGPDLAEAITRKVQKINLEIMQKNGWPVTFSIGVVTFINPPSTVDEILKVSDNLMYGAKNNGKNTIKYEVAGIKEWPPITVA